MTDAELILRARGGDELAFRRLADRYRAKLRGIAADYYLPGGSADDLHQEALVGLHKAVRGYKPERNGSFSAFASLCIRRQVLTAVTAANRRKHEPLNGRRDLVVLDTGEGGIIDPEDCHSAYADPDSDPLHCLIQQEDWDEVRRLCLTLSVLEGRVLGSYLSDLDYNEIAAEIGCTRKTVDNALQRCRHKLSEGMAVAA
jgi:RNA polymerase sporulation-specific sigma factor